MDHVTSIATAIIAAAGIVIAARAGQTHKTAQATYKKASQAAAWSQPTGNGFATEMRTFAEQSRKHHEEQRVIARFHERLLIRLDERVARLEEFHREDT